MSDRLVTPADVAMLERIAHKTTWYVMANPEHEATGTPIGDAEHLWLVCHPDNEQRLRDLVALAQEHVT